MEKAYSEAKECHLQHKNGHDVSVIKNASVVKDENNKVVGIVETVTDLTETEKDAFREAFKPVHAEFRDVVGGDLIDAVYELNAKN